MTIVTTPVPPSPSALTVATSWPRPLTNTASGRSSPGRARGTFRNSRATIFLPRWRSPATAKSSLAFNADGTQLAACESRDALRIWDLRQIREQLADMGLDWDLPPYPPN